MKILIGGDLVPTMSNYDYFRDGNSSKIIDKKILEIWKKADARIFNLEAPICDKGKAIIKCGPNLNIPSSCVAGIKELKPTLLSIANNHILDYGLEGLKETINILNSNNISFIGAGLSREKIVEYYILGDVGIYSICEHEFSCPDNENFGANGIDFKEITLVLKFLKECCNRIIVLFHGGKEEYQYPTPLLQKKCRDICKLGADLVVCQHSHCIGCYEKYEESNIVYGQGNFIFDYSDSSELWKTGLLIEYDTITNKIEYIPFVNCNGKICSPNKFEFSEIMSNFEERSNDIADNNFVYNNYMKVVASSSERYLTTLAGYNRVKRKVNKVLKNKILKKQYDLKKLLQLKNFIECETHREILLSYIDKAIKDKIREE